MIGDTVRLIAALSALFLFFPTTQAVELLAIYEPKCTDDFRGNADNCQGAIDELLKSRGGLSVTDGPCYEVITHGDCAIDLCDMNDQKSSVDIGGIAAAAQNIIGACQDAKSGQSAGSAQLEGFEQKDQQHSVATVKLRLEATAISVIGRSPAIRGRTGSKDAHEQNLARRNPRLVSRTDPNSRTEYANRNGNSPFVVVERNMFRVDQAPETYHILGPVRDTLRDGLLRDWNRRRNNWLSSIIRRTNVRTEHIADNTGFGRMRYDLGVTARGTGTVSDFSIVDRADIVNAFFRLHEAEGSPRMMTAYVHNGDGSLAFMMTIIVNEMDAQPAPPRGNILFGSMPEL